MPPRARSGWTARHSQSNYIKPAQPPYTNAVGQVYDSGAFAHMLERASKLADWDGFAARKRRPKRKACSTAAA